MQGSHIVNRVLAAGALFGAIAGAIVGWIGRDFGFWIPTATAIGVGIGLVIEVGRGPQL
jgi:hypothetical protein